MKKKLIVLIAIVTNSVFIRAQTKTLTVDANDILNNNTKIVAQTTGGQIFFTGHQLGGTYSMPAGIFRAITDNADGSQNFFFDGVTNGVTKYSVRADGLGYFAGGINTSGLLTSSNNGQAGLHIYNGGGNSEWLFQQKSQTDASLYISRLVSGVQTDFMVVNNVGNVGIGTNSLGAKFNVYQSVAPGSVAQNSSLLSSVSGICGTGNTFQNNLWLVRNSTGNDWYTIRLHDGVSIDNAYQSPQINTLTWWERDPSQNIQSWGSQNSTYLSINNGNVGIGTVDNANWQLKTSSYKLAVNGGIIATAVTVKTAGTWPDYVFKPTYKLRSLSELKTYIKQNQHLPDIPSDTEIKKEGVDLGEMNKMLLKKVEELSLYLIEKDQKEKSYQGQLNQLKKQVKWLMKQKKS